MGEIYFKRVLEESDLDIIKKTISENKNYLDFYNNLVNKYKNEIENLINNLEFDKEIKSKLKFFRQMKLKNLSDFVNKYKNQKYKYIFKVRFKYY